MKHLAALAVLGSALAMPAFAGGPVVTPTEPAVTPVAPMVMPSADWSGFYAGAQLGYGDLDSNGAGLDGSGMLGGLHAGYRWDMGNTVLGVGADWDTADIDLGAAGSSLDNVMRLKLMAGADLGRSLIYVTGGPAWADATVAGVGRSDTGWFLGAGMDYALTDQWTVGAELLGHQFDDFDGTGVDLDATTVAAKVSFRF